MKRLIPMLAAGTILSGGLITNAVAGPAMVSAPMAPISQNDSGLIDANTQATPALAGPDESEAKVQLVSDRYYRPWNSAQPVASQQRARVWPRHRVQKRTGIFALFGNQPQQQRRVQKQRRYTRKSYGYRQQSRQLARPQGAFVDLSGPMTQDRVNRMVAAQRRDAARQRPLDPEWLPQTVNYQTSQKKGTIVIDTEGRHLYLVLGDGKARRYGVGVGKPGFEWAGTHKVSRKAKWPDWRPPAEMIERERANGRELPTFMEGGLANPLGARALYIGSTMYRIHGTNQPWTIGRKVSSGCIRMRNEDVEDLYERVPVGAKVVVS